MIMVDAPQVIWEYLTTSGTDLFTLVGKEVILDMLEKDDGSGNGFRNTSPAVVMRVDEAVNANANQVRVRATFLCYGGSDDSENARAVYEALSDRLQNGNGATATGGIISAFQETGGGRLDDPDEGWPVRMAVYDLLIK